MGCLNIMTSRTAITLNVQMSQYEAKIIFLNVDFEFDTYMSCALTFFFLCSFISFFSQLLRDKAPKG